MTVAEPKLGTNYSEMPPVDARSGDEGTTDDGDTPTDGSGDGGVDRAEVETDTVLPPPVDLAELRQPIGYTAIPRFHPDHQCSSLIYSAPAVRVEWYP